MKKITLVAIIAVFLLTACQVNTSNLSIDSKYKVKTYEAFQALKEEAKEDYVAVEKIETMPLQDMKNLELGTIFSDIEIIYEDRLDVEVQYFAFIAKDSLTTQPDYFISKTGDFIFEVDWHNFNGAGHGMMRVFIPHAFKNDLDASSISGDLYSTAISASQLDLKTISGDIDIQTLEAEDIKMQTTSGNIKVASMIGKDLDIDSTSGDVEVSKMEVHGVEVDLISGNVVLKLKSLQSDMAIDTVSGKVDLSFEEVPNASLDLKTVSGNIALAYDLSQVDIKKDRSLKGLVGQGKYKIDIDTISGHIKID